MSQFLFLLTAVVLGGLVGAAVRLLVGRARDKQDIADLKERVNKALDDITADGKVEGPKGRYESGKRRSDRRGMKTPNETEPPRRGGRYSQPWP